MGKKNYLLFCIIGSLCFFLFIFGNNLFPQVVSAFNKLSSQFFYYLYPKAGLAKNIVIVQIDDYSLSKINRTWPFPRSFYVTALKILNEEGARTIGVDVVFQGQGPSKEDDTLLKAALADLKGKVVLASYFNTQGILESSELFGEEATIAFVNAVSGKDGLVKSLKGTVKEDNFVKFCWAVEIVAKYYGVVAQKEERNIILNQRALPLDEGDILPINYLLKPKDFERISFYDLIKGRFPANFFKDRIVLIGSTAEIVHDILPTPLGRMPGVFIQANEILTILSGKYLTVLHPAATLAILFLSLAAVSFIIISFSLLSGLILCLGILVMIFWLNIGLKFLGWDLSFGSLALPVLGFFILGSLYNYFRFITMLNKIKNQMIIDPFSQLFKLHYLYERLKLDAGSFPKKNQWIVVAVLEGFIASSKGKSFESLRKLWREINLILFASNQLWARCGQEALVGIESQKLNLDKLKKGLTAVFFEQEMPVKIKLGAFRLTQSSLNVRDFLPFVVSELMKTKEEIILLDALILPQHKVHKGPGIDFLASLYSDSETKNEELLEAIEKRIEEERKRQTAYLEFISALVNALESKDPYTEGHSENVCQYALRLAEAVGMSAEEQGKIKTAALLHDLGKIGIPDKILHKKDALTPEEFAFIKEHEVLSTKILEPLEEFKEILPYILHHHENYDGSGYPHGLAGNFIPLGARIIAIADVFDALTTGRDYRQALSVEQAVQMLRQMRAKRLDPELVENFIKLIKKV